MKGLDYIVLPEMRRRQRRLCNDIDVESLSNFKFSDGKKTTRSCNLHNNRQNKGAMNDDMSSTLNRKTKKNDNEIKQNEPVIFL